MNQMAHMPPVVMSVGGKAGGLTFEHVLQKLQVIIGDYLLRKVLTASAVRAGA